MPSGCGVQATIEELFGRKAGQASPPSNLPQASLSSAPPTQLLEQTTSPREEILEVPLDLSFPERSKSLLPSPPEEEVAEPLFATSGKVYQRRQRASTKPRSKSAPIGRQSEEAGPAPEQPQQMTDEWFMEVLALCKGKAQNRLTSPGYSKLTPKRVCVQYHLDFGQRDFFHTTCSKCGLMYSPGEEHDEKVHKRFHRSFLQAVRFQAAGCDLRARQFDAQGGWILLITPHDPPQLQRKVKEITGIVEVELGLPPGWLLKKPVKTFLYIAASREVAGCLMAEAIEQAFPVREGSSTSLQPEPDRDRPDLGQSELTPCSTSGAEGQLSLYSQLQHSSPVRVGSKRTGSDRSPPVSSRQVASTLGAGVGLLGPLEVCENERRPAVCGIRAIWVQQGYRRRGVAWQLLETMRSRFSVGCKLQPSQCAFSSPTPVGCALAAAFFGSDSLLVYH